MKAVKLFRGKSSNFCLQDLTVHIWRFGLGLREILEINHLQRRFFLLSLHVPHALSAVCADVIIITRHAATTGVLWGMSMWEFCAGNGAKFSYINAKPQHFEIKHFEVKSYKIGS